MLIRSMYFPSVILFSCLLCSSFASIVKFLPAASFNMPNSFRDGRLPCSKETVVFPETMLSYVNLEADTSVNGFILPRDGEIIIADATIEFGAVEDDVNCTNQGNVYYVENSVVSWSQPNVWSSPRFNDATPDAERVPCFDDTVEFPAKSDFTLILPDESQYVFELKVDNVSYATFNIMRLLAPMKGQFIDNRFSDTGVHVNRELCRARSGCSCQKYPLKINCETKFCPVPTCVYPIKPEGHCCKICGGVIAFDIDETFDMMVFREFVESAMDSDNLLYHVGRLPNNKVQLVVVDKTEYSGESAEIVNTIDHQMKSHWVQGAKFVDISGSPLYKSGLGGKIFISMFFLVVFVMGGIYAYYYKLAGITEARFPNLHRSTPGVFSRFQARTDSVVCLTRRDSDTAIGRSSIASAFKNPLYDSMNERVEADEASGDHED